MVLRNLAFFYVVTGRLNEAIDLCKRSIEMDPIQPIAFSYLAYAYYFSGDPARADSCFRRRSEISSTYRAFFGIDKFVDLAVLGPTQALRHYSSERNELRRLFGSTLALATLSRSQAMDSLIKMEQKYKLEDPAGIALAYAHLGNEEAAFQWLEKAMDNPSGELIFIKVYPPFSSMRDDPRFAALLKRMNFPQ
jgi:tetratricopeptide (TPR) repeat protein